MLYPRNVKIPELHSPFLLLGGVFLLPDDSDYSQSSFIHFHTNHPCR